MVIEDFILLAKQLVFLPSILLPSASSDPAFRKEFSETSNFPGLRNKISLLRKMTFGEADGRHQIIHWHKARHSTDEWFFINGICTTKELAELNIEAISALFNAKVTALYNPTDGIIRDLSECIYERTFDKFAPITEELLDRILNAVNAKKHVKIIAHSQGGIIASNLLKALREINGKYNIELYTFASAADENVEVEGVYQEHFCNEYDFVARMGLLNEDISSNVYVLPKTTGHFLNRDYLEHFKQAKYCNGNSRLFKYLNKS